ncbi:MAG TPA: glycoside hydrolase family 3 N-terminal domain-containing protein, partial [Thermomicrobiales bacterium]|nr:glycoside hydrolase family 3 N-terminal domain-containing protein [Thermomicrobiales bacterium]
GDILAASAITAIQLREVGINVNFAPTVDVNNNPANPVIRTRAWGDTPEQVAENLEWVYRGYESARVVTTVKHFPGHGDTSVDSHLGLPTIPYTRDRIDTIELAPFRAAVDLGVPAVMSAHILFPELDPEYPATLSHDILAGLLRAEMGFTGLVFTDSMSMRAISERYGLSESTILAKLAGVDVLEANESIADQGVRRDALLDALESGRIPRDAFETTADRLDTVRARYAITGENTPLRPQPERRWDTIFAIALRTIAHVGRKPFAPLANDQGNVFIDFQRFRTTEAEDPVGRAQVLRDAVRANIPDSTVVTLSNDPTESEVAEASTRAAAAHTLVILTRDASDLPLQVEIANRAIAAAPGSARVIHCSMRGPYDAGTLAPVDDYLFTFGDPRISIEALMATLVGLQHPDARMPVTVPTLGELHDRAVAHALASGRIRSKPSP